MQSQGGSFESNDVARMAGLRINFREGVKLDCLTANQPTYLSFCELLYGFIAWAQSPRRSPRQHTTGQEEALTGSHHSPPLFGSQTKEIQTSQHFNFQLQGSTKTALFGFAPRILRAPQINWTPTGALGLRHILEFHRRFIALPKPLKIKTCARNNYIVHVQCIRRESRGSKR